MSADGLILVVDDNKIVREVLARRLTQAGYAVEMAENGQLALNLAAQLPLMLVLLDVEMPGLNGLEVLDRLRLRHSLSELPVFMVSATQDYPLMVDAIERGANDFLTKPIHFDLLLAKIRQQLGLRQHSQLGQELRVGSMVGHYRLTGKLGEGAMGVVFRAHDTHLLREVALKIVNPDVVHNHTNDIFLVEARAVARVDHPSVVRIHEIGHKPCKFIAMELVDGETLSEYATRDLELREVRDVMLQLLSAIGAVHEAGIVHRDLKPSNVMITPEGRVKIMDFGLARSREFDLRGASMAGICGTPQYMAPEHFGGTDEVDSQSDLFAVGVMLYEILTGYLPFTGPTIGELLYSIARDRPTPPVQLRSSIPEELSAACLGALEKDKQRRYRTAQEFALALRRCRL